MNEIDHLKVFVLYTEDMTADVNQLHVNRIHLVSFSYIVIYNGDVTANVYHLHIKRIHLIDFSYILIDDYNFGSSFDTTEFYSEYYTFMWKRYTQ
jgi:hypothetical protein